MAANVYMAATITVTAARGFMTPPSTSTSQTAAPLILLRARANSPTAKGRRSLVLSRRATAVQLPAVQLLQSSFDLPNNCIPVGGRRSCLAAAGLLILAMGLSLTGGTPAARGAVLEADDDIELLEKVKKDRKKRLERQGFISSSGRETAGYLQEVVYKLSKVGQAIDNNDLSAAGSILGPDAKADWLKNVNAVFAKLSSSREEKIEVDTFNNSLVSLIGSVAEKDVESSKLAFVTSASALEKWVAMTGLAGELTGL